MPEHDEQDGYIPGTNLPSTGPGSPVEVLAGMPIFVPPGGFPNAPANGAINLAPGAVVPIPGVPGPVTIGPGATLVGLPPGTTWASWGGIVVTYTLPNGQVVILGWGGRNGLCVFWGPSENPPPVNPPVNPTWWVWTAVGSLITGAGYLAIINSILEAEASNSSKCDDIKNKIISQITLSRQWAANLNLGFNVILRAVSMYLTRCPNMSQHCKDRAVDAFNTMKAAIVKMKNIDETGMSLHQQVVNVDCAPFGNSTPLISALGNSAGPLVTTVGNWINEIQDSLVLLNSWVAWLATFRSDCYCLAAEDEIFRTFVPGLPPVPGQPPIQ